MRWKRTKSGSGGLGCVGLINGKKLKIEASLAIMHLECIFARIGQIPLKDACPQND